jgi:glycosyltransferase involved in cell wall biosynthesis
MRRVVFDITNLAHMVSNIPHGLIRVEAAFAKAFLLNWNATEIIFVRRVFCGILVKVSIRRVTKILDRPFVPSQPKTIIQRELLRAVTKSGFLGIPFFFKKSDLYINVGGLDQLIRGSILQYAIKFWNLPFVTFCHDLIPINHPYWVNNANFRARYEKGLAIASKAKLVFCNSESTSLDLRRYFLRHEISPIPDLVVLELASDKLMSEPRPPEVSPPLTPKQYVLSVGTITERKNQDLLLNVWSRFFDDPILSKIKLVLVGEVGRGSEAQVRRLKLDPLIMSNVIHFQSMDDEGLAWLYQNSMFTVYPSYYEGWGLPVGESLAYGKICIASSSSSMPEVGKGLCLHIDPYDFKGWHDAIIAMIKNLEIRKTMETNINANFKAKSWGEVGQELVKCLANRFGQNQN